MIAKTVLQDSLRGMDLLYEHIELDIFEQAAAELLAQPKDRNILLCTGFATAGKQKADGPVGAYFLAKALFELGYYPIIVSDYYCKNYFDQAAQNFETLMVPLKGFGEQFMYSKILETYDPVALIAVERPGRSADGLYRNLKGECIDGENAPLDLFFETDQKLLTIGIGDSGNEIGMGKYAALLEKHLAYQNPCCIVTGHCLMGTTSSWACYGLIAAMGKNFLPSVKKLENYYDYIFSLGTEDGVTPSGARSVNRQIIDKSLEIIEKLKEYT